MFGRAIEGGRVAYWGARAIYKGFTDKYFVDLLPDRQGGDNVSDGFLFWLNNRALPWLRYEVKRLALATDTDQAVSFSEYKYYLEASPQRSYGYLYVGAVERPVTSGGTIFNEAVKKDEKVLVVEGKRFAWGAPHDVPEPGTKGIVTVNGIGPGVVVGYQDEKYAETARLLNLRVKLDNPPDWWVRQERSRRLPEVMAENLWWFKEKWRRQIDELPREGVERKRGFRNISDTSPKQLFSPEGLKAYREWDAEYKPDTCIVWDADFKRAA